MPKISLGIAKINKNIIGASFLAFLAEDGAAPIVAEAESRNEDFVRRTVVKTIFGMDFPFF